MITLGQRALAIVVIWILFLILIALGFGVSLVAAPAGALLRRRELVDYAERCMRSANKAAGAAIGFDGKTTISASCGASSCRFCRMLCPVLSRVLADPGHCANEAAKERQG